jgi:hypothetical protein
MTVSENVTWDEVEEAASKMFNVWLDGQELNWAKEAWNHLSAAGLTSRETFLEETKSKLRLVTLARIYQEFCGLAWDENCRVSSHRRDRDRSASRGEGM